MVVVIMIMVVITIMMTVVLVVSVAVFGVYDDLAAHFVALLHDRYVRLGVHPAAAH